MDEKFAVLIGECKRIQKYCLWNASTHFQSASLARLLQLVGGSIPIALGALGGWKFLSDPAVASPRRLILAGVCTLMAGVIGSLMAFWDLSKGNLEHFSAATKYKTLENDARRAHEIHCKDEEYAVFKERVLKLANRYDELGESSTQTHDIAYWLAERRIKSGEYDTPLQ